MKRMVCIVAVLIVTAGMVFAGGQSEGDTTELRFVAANHPFTDVIRPLLSEFEAETGIVVNMENYEENQLTQRLTVEFTSGNSDIDIFMTRPLQEGKLFSRNGYYSWLDDAIATAGADFGWDDYPASTRGAVEFEGRVYAVPIVTEWETLFYRTDLFEEAGISVPTTLAELMAAARALHDPDNEVYGIVSRGQRGAAVTQFSSYLYNYGGDFIEDGYAVFNTPEALAAFAYYGELLGEYGPPGVTNMSWPQAQALFAAGSAAMWTDASVLIAGLLDPETSQVADVLGVAPFPAGPRGNSPYMVVPWALAISAQSENQEAAWRFMEWAAGKAVAVRAQAAGLTMARTSAWEDPAVADAIFPGLAESGSAISATALPYDRPLMTAVSEARDSIGSIIVSSIERSGAGDLTDLADAAVEEVNALLESAGELGQ